MDSSRVEPVQYNRQRGEIRVYDSLGTLVASYTELAAVIDAIATGALPPAAGPPVAGYGLALAARLHDDWPTESRRAALIQTAYQLRNASTPDDALDRMLDAILARANDVLLRGDAQVEQELVAAVETYSAAM